LNTSQNLIIHNENTLIDFLTKADTADFILDTETSNPETINEPTSEEENVSCGNYK